MFLVSLQATSGSASSAELTGTDADAKEEKSEIYSNNMTEAMGAGKKNLRYIPTI